MPKERRKVKSKGERERYTQLNVEFQRIARRDKKDFFNEQCKEKQKYKRMGKTKDLLKKIGDFKGISHGRMGMIKDRTGKDLTEAEGIKNRWQEYTEELYKKHFNDRDNHYGMATHLELDILECDVKWILGKITVNKASRGDEFQLRALKFLKKMILLKCCT